MPGICRLGSLAARQILPVLGILSLLCVGCHLPHRGHECCEDERPDVPRELAKVSLPPYVIEPPDILLIDAIRLIPKPPYYVEPGDALAIRATETLQDQPISGIFGVDPDGTVNLGFNYGSVELAGLTLAEARAALAKHLRELLKPSVQVNVSVAESRALQLIRGPHLVRIDGTISLGVYGSVYVDNLTIPQARAAIEAHLSQFLVKPEISLDVSGFNSKVYYVIADGGGFGEQVTRLPMTGKTTVLDAISQVNGLPPVACKCHIWVARPTPTEACQEQTLPVNWCAITQRGETATNYQVLPGDRIYVQSNPLVRADTFLARLYSPIERTFGVILLGTTTVHSFNNNNNGSSSR
jgi:polysaccharide export outer membrane protein